MEEEIVIIEDDSEIELTTLEDDSELELSELESDNYYNDYEELRNLPKINDVKLIGNKTLDDLGIQPKGDYLTSETDPVYTTDKPNIATKSEVALKVDKITGKGLSTNDLTDELKSTYDAKQDALGFTPENIANKDQALGYSSLDSGGKVPLSNLPSNLLKYVGVWNANTNTPTLITPDTTKKGYVYNVGTPGTQFGITFSLGDWLIYNDNGIPEKSDNSDDVVSVNSKTGTVVLNTDDISDTSTNRYVSDSDISNWNGKVNKSGDTMTGKLNLEAKTDQLLSIKRTDVFDFVQYRRSAGTWTDITLEAGSSLGTVSGDVLDAIGDTFVIGKTEKFNNIFIDIGTAKSSGGVLVWEYSLGSDTWSTLTCADGTNSLTIDGIVSFESPIDWATDSQNSSAQMYFVRLRVDSGSFSTEPTVYLVSPNDGKPIVEVYAAGNDTTPSFGVTRGGVVVIGYANTLSSTARLAVAGGISLSGTLSGITTATSSGAETNTISSTGFTHVGGKILTTGASTALIPNQNSPVIRFQSNGWNGFASKTNAMDIYMNPDAEPITQSRLAFKNTMENGYAEASELMSLDNDGRLSVMGRAQSSDSTFDSVQHYVGGAYVDDTLIVQTLGLITVDVLNVVGEFLYIGKRNTFNNVYFDFQTIMSAGTTRSWEYWNGSAWVALTVTDETNNWANDGNTSFTPPVDWAKTVVNSVGPIYYIRVGTVSGSFSVEPTLRFCLPQERKDVFSNGEFDGDTGWSASGDWGYSASDFTFTYSTGAGTLTQAYSSFATPPKPNTWYRFRYVIGVVGGTNTIAWIGEEFACGKTYFRTDNTTEVDVFFKSNSNPGDFVIYTTASASGLRLDAVELMELTDGNLDATGEITKGKEQSKVQGVTFTQTADKVIANTTTETTMFGTGVGSLTVPANSLVAGRTYRIKMKGYASGTNGDTSAIKVKLGGAELASSTATWQTLTDVNFALEFDFTCRTTGATGTVVGNGYTLVSSGQGFSTVTMRALKDGVQTINTTINNAIDLTYQWSSASTGNTVTVTNVSIEVLN